MARFVIIDKDRALQAARLVFWRQGYKATPVIDLAVTMRLNRAGLYKAFGSKHQLFIQVLRQYQQELHSQRLKLSADTGKTVLVRLRLVLELTVGIIPAARSLPKSCFLLQAGSELLPQDAAVQAVVDEDQQSLESLLTRLLHDGQQTGEVRLTASPQAQAHFLGSVMAGLRVTRQFHANPAMLRNTVELTLLALAGEPAKEPAGN